ncbi:MAG: hypothetical protein LBB11_03825 [Puniceicoccales bacterium]|jgi:prepilin-type processing-associated H-X9-DG protein|nr:hypothetical protein [Puniceicoccales bacterium]
MDLRSKASFSVVEFVSIIGTVAILLSITFPISHRIIERSQRAQGAQNLRVIALAHANFIHDFGRPVNYRDLAKMKNPAATRSDGPHDVNLLAAVFAKYGYIKNISVWAWDFDHLVRQYRSNQGMLPVRIYDASNDKIDPEFAGRQSAGSFPLSVACCVIQCLNYDYTQLLNSQFPVACSRGLYSDGKWRKKFDGDVGGIWGNHGGLIAFFDGHVEWYQDIQGMFHRYGTAISTTILCELLPNAHSSIDQQSPYADSCFLNWQGNGAYGHLH